MQEKREIIYGTENHAKIDTMQNRLENLGIRLIGLREAAEKYHVSIPHAEEKGSTLLENAREKAYCYYGALKKPVFSCDSGLYFDNVPKEEQPGIYVRRVGGKNLSDEEMVEYYTGLVKKYGNLTARYRNAICMVLDDNRVYEAADQSLESEPFLLTCDVRPIKRKGFPLDSFSVDLRTGQHYYDLEDKRQYSAASEEGFTDFFRKYFL